MTSHTHRLYTERRAGITYGLPLSIPKDYDTETLRDYVHGHGTTHVFLVTR